MTHTAHHTECGLTLIELLIVMAISLVVLAMAMNTFIMQRRSYALQEQVTEMIQHARTAMDILSRELRMAGYDPAGAGFAGITYDPTQVRIRADLNGDGNTDDANEDIVYIYDAVTRQIVRTTTGVSQPIAENIQAWTFTYLDSTGTPTTATAAIRQLQLSITARTAKPDPTYAANGGHRSFSLTSLVTPANLAY